MKKNEKVYPVPEKWKETSWCNIDEYKKLYDESIENPKKFWGEQAKRIDWIRPWSEVSKVSFYDRIDINWFINGKLNASANCIDRHLEKNGNKIAIIWEGDDPNISKKITYNELHEEVCIFANILKLNNVKKGDRVTIYLPMIPEAAYAMLACSRIGAIHSVVFGGFSPEALSDRINDCKSSFVITADEGLRGGKIISLKDNVDKALEKCSGINNVLVINRTNAKINYNKNRDLKYTEEKSKVTKNCEPEIMDSEEPLFILYTSGSTGKPKGVLHTTGGYLVHTSLTHKYIFDYHENDIFWCTADVGWVTGHSYIVYGPLINGATTVMFEGVPNYPNSSRFWEVCDKHGVTIFYTAPTAIRALMKEGEGPLKSSSRDSLRLLGSVGEPINPEAWEWYYTSVGKTKCPIVDTWWQTETGGIMISALAGITPNKPAHASLPLPGVIPVIVDAEGNELNGNNVQGNLCIKSPWPSIIRTTYGDHERCINTYFSNYKGMYFTGDGVKRDHDGYLRILGRVDDVINVSGHRMGTAEVENAINEHEDVIESAVVGYPHDIKGEGIYAYVIVSTKLNDDKIKDEIINVVRKVIGPIAKPDKIQIVSGLPKTRSGKIMRRILRKVASNDFKNLGDTSTLLNPDVVKEIIDGAII